MNAAQLTVPVSILMSLYWKEKPEYLRASLESIYTQTLMPNEIVCVLDGPVGDALSDVLREYAEKSQKDPRLPQFITIALPENGGLGKSLNIGLEKCSNELVARMDTDDISKPERIAKQYAYMMSHPEISASGTWIEEFIGTPANIISERVTESEPHMLAVYARMRNPLNHPTVIFRKSDVIKAGSYQHCPYFEDYFLWVRMIENGMKLSNIPETLLSYRASRDMFKRRGGLNYMKDNTSFQRMLYKRGFITKSKSYMNIFIRNAVYMMPCWLRASIYPHFIHRKK